MSGPSDVAFRNSAFLKASSVTGTVEIETEFGELVPPNEAAVNW